MIISLIIPPSPFLGDEKRNSPLGILYIASWLEQHGHNIYVSDLRGVDEEYWISKIHYGEMYGFTATTPEYPYALAIAKKVRECASNSLIIIGGVHCTAVPSTIDPVFDKVIRGEGEMAILELIHDLENGKIKRFYSCPTQVDRIEDINTIPFPARHLVPITSIVSYTSTIAGEASTTIIGSRGCPYNCGFCSSKVMWDRKVRFRSPDNIIAEIKHLIKDYGVTHFRFQDDTLSVNKRWIRELCEKMKPLNITWRGTTRVDHASTEILQIMKDAGCYEIAFGIETLEDEILEMNNKQITNDQIHLAVQAAYMVGLKTRLFFMIGLPGQGLTVADDIIAFIKECNPTAVNLSTFVPMPGSDIYNNPKKYGIEILEQDWSKYTMSKGLYGNELEHPFIFKHDKLTDEQLREQRKKILEYFAEHNLSYNK